MMRIEGSNRLMHNLEDLFALLLPLHPQLLSLRRGLIIFLSEFAVETRYPGENAIKRQMESARRWATEVRAAVRPIRGLPVR